MLKKLIFYSTAFLGLILLTQPPALSGMPPALKKRIGVPPFKVIREVLTTNTSGAGGERARRDQQRETPYLTWLTENDPGISSSHILPGGTDIITVSNPGCQVAVSPGSLNYGIYQLHTPVLLITGISDSRHVRSYLEGYDDVSLPLRLNLDHLHPSLKKEAAINLDRESPAEKLLRLVETNVDYQVEQALKRYEERIADGRLVVIGSVFDTTNHYGKGRNRLIIMNINGRKGEKLLDMRLIRQLKPELRRYVKGEEK